MSFSLILSFGLVALLMTGLVWALWQPRTQTQSSIFRNGRSLNSASERPVIHLPQIRQVLSAEDFEYVGNHASRESKRRFRKERLRIVRGYLDALRTDFSNLLRMARVIAVLSPQIVAVEEFERLRLTATFRWRYQVIRWRLLAGLVPMAQLEGLSNVVSGLSVRMETAIRELGERTALAAELASSREARGLDSP